MLFRSIVVAGPPALNLGFTLNMIAPIFNGLVASLPAAPTSAGGLLAIAACCCTNWPGGSGCSVPLPFDEFNSFRVVRDNKKALLSWEVAGSHFSNYKIFRGISPDELKEVAELPASAITYSESFEESGKRFYQLTGIGWDGKEEMSPLREITGIASSGIFIESFREGELLVKFHSDSECHKTVSVCDIQGRILLSENRSFNAGNNEFSIGMNDYSDGVYFLVIGEETLKWVK